MISSGIFAHDIHGKGPTGRALEAGYNCRAYNEDGSYSYGLSENIYEYLKESLENLFPFWEGGEEWLKWSGVTG